MRPAARAARCSPGAACCTSSADAATQKAPQADRGRYRRGRACRRADLPAGPRHRAGVLHGHRDGARRRRTDKGRLHRRARPCARAICWRRSIRGRYQAAYDQAVATKAKDAAQLANAKRDLRALYAAAARGSRRASKPSTRSARTVDQLAAQMQVDQAVDRQRPHPARLHAHHLADRRPHRDPAGRSGQHRACRRHHRHRGGDPGAADLGRSSRCPRRTWAPSARRSPRARSRSRRSRATAATVLDEGTLTLIDNQIDQATGTIRLKATFDNTHNTLWPGQYVNARVLVRTERSALTDSRRGRAAGARRPLHLCRQERLDRRGPAADHR